MLCAVVYLFNYMKIDLEDRVLPDVEFMLWLYLKNILKMAVLFDLPKNHSY